MYRKLTFLFMIVVMVGLMTMPVGKANAQVETQGSAPDCPPSVLMHTQDQKSLQVLSLECVKARRALIQNAGSQTSVKDTLSVANDAGSIVRSEVSRLGPPYLLYLPLVTNNFMSGISGRVTYQGNPIGGIPIELRFWNGSSYSSMGFAYTQTNGSYQFTSAPSLGSGQSYYIRYWNTTNVTYVNYCGGNDLNSYIAGSTAAGGSFDIANIPQVSPPHGANVALPYAFQWTRRVGVPSDNYFFEIFKPDYSYGWASPTLGYVSQYTLNSLPTSSFSFGTTYYWDVGVAGVDGSYCYSFDQSRTVIFH
jgi:hypothetical protein